MWVQWECSDYRGERRGESLNRAGGGGGGLANRWGWGITEEDNSSSGSVGIFLAYKFPPNSSHSCSLKPE